MAYMIDPTTLTPDQARATVARIREEVKELEKKIAECKESGQLHEATRLYLKITEVCKIKYGLAELYLTDAKETFE